MAKLERSGIKRIVEIFVWLVLQAVLLFAAAGRLDLPRAWAYFGVMLGYMLASQAITLLFLRDRMAEVMNARGASHEGTKGWDKVMGVLYGVGLLVAPVVAGLDAGRFGWSSLGRGFLVPALVVTVLGNALAQWAILSNKHFEKTVRIQSDRDHRVVTTGPYRLVRHPGYVGIIAFSLAFPFVVGSAWALIPAGVSTLTMIVRTALEDRTLRRELDGYADYARKTRYRLFPGLW